MSDEKVPVLVTTDGNRRGVFFGYAQTPVNYTACEIELWNVRMVVYWPAECRGVVGLADNPGPVEGTRVSHTQPHAGINGVTLILDCSDNAVDMFEEGPWTDEHP